MHNVFADIFKYRQMIFSLVHKELRGRYKGSVLGFLWTFFNPLLQLVVYTFVFSILMRQAIDRYYLFLFVALVPWIFFSSCVAVGANCVFIYGDLAKKIYFPREVLPVSFVTAQFVNMLYTFIVVSNEISENALSGLTHRIKESVARATTVGNAKVEVGASIGYARYPHGGTEFANTIQISEEMMYADKKMIGEER